jgi:hypothetical protein
VAAGQSAASLFGMLGQCAGQERKLLGVGRREIVDLSKMVVRHPGNVVKTPLLFGGINDN